MVYVDSDGVLADFYGWCRQYDNSITVNDSEKIRALMVQKADECFLTCSPLPFSSSLLNAVRKNNNYRVLTALTAESKLLKYCKNEEECKRIVQIHRENKYRWYEKLGIPRSKVIITDGLQSKAEFCKKGDYLIDDYEKNIKEWKEAGGIGIHLTWQSNGVA